MAYSYDFKSNVVYGAEDINAIRASVLTKGVVEETSFSCKAELTEGKVKVCEGQAVFTDGSRIKIDEDGVELEFTSGVKNYVFLLNNTLAEICEVKAEEALPDDDYILIAEIDAEGNLSDKRKFAQLKTADAERFSESFYTEFVMRDDMNEGDIIHTVTLPKSNCSLMRFYMAVNTSLYMDITFLPKEGIVVWNYQSTGEFKIGEKHSFYSLEDSRTRTLEYEVSGDKFIIKFVSSTRKEAKSSNIKIAGICQR